MCGRNQPGHGRQEREAGVRVAGEDLLPRVQQSVLPPHSQALDGAPLQLQDEPPDRVQWSTDVSLHRLGHGEVHQ